MRAFVQTLVNVGGSSEQVCLCKTELSAEAGRKFEGDFLNKIQSLHADKVRILFRIDIRSAMDCQFEDWLFQQLAGKKPSRQRWFVHLHR